CGRRTCGAASPCRSAWPCTPAARRSSARPSVSWASRTRCGLEESGVNGCAIHGRGNLPPRPAATDDGTTGDAGGRELRVGGAGPVLRQVALDVAVPESEFVRSNAVVVRGRSGAPLVDPGITGAEIDCLANDVRETGQPVVAGFSTHPDWDHLLWHDRL